MDQSSKKVVIVGGGFAGVTLAKQLNNQPGFDVTLVDSNNYNFFPPLLYQVATGFLEPSSISYPFRKFLRGKKNIRFRMGELKKVLPDERQLVLSNGTLSYDLLVLATGATTNYFGMEQVQQNAIPMKTLSDALAMRNTLLNRLEEASRTTDVEYKRKLVTFVVAGAGPTGVEISGMFAEMRATIIRKDYPDLVGRNLGEIFLVDGGDAVLKPMSKNAQQYSKKSLEALGVHIKLNTTVKDFVNDTVLLSDGSTIETKNLIWAAGVAAKTFEGIPAACYGRGKRLIVDAYNKVAGVEDIYAIGDTCLQTTDAAFPNGHPQVAQVALQQGSNLAKNLLHPQRLKPFAYVDKGSMAIIGRNKAVADLTKPKMRFGGFFAWLIWLFIHVMSLLTLKNRLRTLTNWIIAYFSRDQSFRMIIRPEDREEQV